MIMMMIIIIIIRVCYVQGRSEVTPAAYAHFTHMMKQLADGKLVLLIEVSNWNCSFINSSLCNNIAASLSIDTCCRIL